MKPKSIFQRLEKATQRGLTLLAVGPLYISVARSILPVRPNFLGIVIFEIPIVGLDWESDRRPNHKHFDLTLYLLNFYLYLCIEP